MEYVLRSIGILIVVIGVIFTARPSVVPAIIAWIKQGKRIYAAAVVRIVLGVLLVAACTAASVLWVPAVVGSLMILSGIVLFVMKVERAFALLDWFGTRSDTVRRLMTTVIALLGVAVILTA